MLSSDKNEQYTDQTINELFKLVMRNKDTNKEKVKSKEPQCKEKPDSLEILDEDQIDELIKVKFKEISGNSGKTVNRELKEFQKVL